MRTDVKNVAVRGDFIVITREEYITREDAQNKVITLKAQIEALKTRRDELDKLIPSLEYELSHLCSLLGGR